MSASPPRPARRRSARTRFVALVAASSLAFGCASFDKGGSSEGSEASITIAAGILGGITLAVTLLNLEVEMAQAEDYLEQRRRPIRVSLARGAGLLVDDLATALALPPELTPVLGAAVHARQADLDRWLADPDVTRDDAVGFFTDVGLALAGEPRLAPYVAATRERTLRALGAAGLSAAP